MRPNGYKDRIGLDDSKSVDPLASAGWPAGPAQPPDPGAEVHLWLADLEAARGALRDVLSRYLGEDPGQIALELDARGKPRLAMDPPRLQFNLSHSGRLALIAVATGRQVGVDVERLKPRRDFLALAERSFGPDTLAAVQALSAAQREGGFYAAWVRHEALAKCDGGGLAGPLGEAEMALAPIELGPGYAAALAVRGDSVPPLRKWSISDPRAGSGANLQA
jgi:4'-phosphopantetheinyl transferase